ncbi:hypothetical protein [Pseudomonas jessenii]|uniref:hypothetical protein n=1 Tax=Pseudomonas jessenii TaxID=77298 RepID=UPI0015F0878B|nr:hypothetical protein [Pseudomonas jessenii]
MVLPAHRHPTVVPARVVSQADLTAGTQEQRSRRAQVEVPVLPVLLAAADERQKARQVQPCLADLPMDMGQVVVGLAV